MKNDRDRTLALAGIYQAAVLTDQVARLGHCEAQAKQASLHSLLQVDADSVELVYGGLNGIELGLRTLHGQLLDGRARNLELTRYVLQLLQLEGKLRAQRKLLDRLANGIHEAQRRLQHFSLDHPNLLAHFAALYQETISTLQPRIMVRGDQQHLNQPDQANLIRSLLLCGIRSAILWRQCDGRRYRILFGRNRLLKECHALLQQL
jgi:high frequency lysogenization protein